MIESPTPEAQQKPITPGLIREFYHSKDPFSLLRQHSNAFPHPQYTRKYDPNSIGSCVDERSFASRAYPISTKNFPDHMSPRVKVDIHGREYHVTFPDLDKALKRDIAANPWPGGYFGAVQFVMWGLLTSGMAKQQNFWRFEGKKFIEEFISYATDYANEKLGDNVLPIHIDNEHGNALILNSDASPNVDVLTTILNNGRGCGALGVSFHTLFGLLNTTGHEEIANELATKLSIQLDNEGVATINTEVSDLASELLYKKAIERGCPVDILIGEHAPASIVFALGTHVLTRDILTRAGGPKHLYFETAIGVLNDENSMASRVLADLFSDFDHEIKPINLVVAYHLWTYLHLGQASTQRQYLD